MALCHFSVFIWSVSLNWWCCLRDSLALTEEGTIGVFYGSVDLNAWLASCLISAQVFCSKGFLKTTFWPGESKMLDFLVEETDLLDEGVLRVALFFS